MSRAAFEQFERYDVVYKVLDGIPFEASILVPLSVIASERPSRPVLVHFHGGAFILGTALDAQTIPLWLLQLAESRGSILVSPCYRLLPEASVSDILDDIKDFWDWTYASLGSVVSGKWGPVSTDLGRIALSGEGAGGTLALHSAFLWPQAKARLVMAQHCGFDPDCEFFNPRPANVPGELDSFVTEYLRRIRPGTFRVSSPFPEYWDLAQAFLRSGRLRELLGKDEVARIRTNLRRATELPPIWIVQGTDDNITGEQVANELADEIRATHPETPLLYSLQAGGHGFDQGHQLTESWLEEGLRFVERYW